MKSAFIISFKRSVQVANGEECRAVSRLCEEDVCQVIIVRKDFMLRNV